MPSTISRTRTARAATRWLSVQPVRRLISSLDFPFPAHPSHTGDVLAIASTDGSEHTLRLYDVARDRFEKAGSIVVLEPFERGGRGGEVTVAAFSPTRDMLALARNDDVVHVYDLRMLCSGRGPVHWFGHDDARDGNEWTGAGRFGVTQMEWVQEWRGGMDGQLGIVTGGGDGSVVLWDVLSSGKNPEELAGLDHGVGQFSLGDRAAGEKRLVVYVHSSLRAMY
ncbi:hypothetical protein K488DRAFT_56024 [Vararia minispora EC-137]|uniref:Uncharacterized protein n=1 Tax=Vararia minispora EC-137 TaxID=1314806 RepID=A0ACB8QCR6_9AGAM|nr:hypothetical protein K488DRAFT_56024 [Vararia minispora EC-137]